MLAEIKRDLRLLKYIPQFKLNIIMSAIVFLMGIPMLLIAKVDNMQAGVMYMLLGFTLIQSNLYTLLRVDMVASSDRRRYIDGLVADVVLMVGSAVSYIVIAVRMAVGMKLTGTDFRYAMVVAILIMIVEILYCGTAYKGWWISSIVFFVVVMWLLMSTPRELIKSLPDIGMGMIIVIGGVAVALANVVACVTRKALYRRPMTFGKNMNLNKGSK